LKKLTGRKFQEGIAAVLFAKRYPQLLSAFPFSNRILSKLKRPDRKFTVGLYKLPILTEIYEFYLIGCLNLWERLRRRELWFDFHRKMVELQMLQLVLMS
jgi:hypothetical protein